MRTSKRIHLGYEGAVTPGFLNTLGIQDGLVLGFSIERIVTGYEGIALKLVRDSDDSELDIYYEDDNSINTATISDFIGASTGLVKQWGNQGNINYPAYQNTKVNMPTWDNTNVRVDFNGTTDFMIVNDYTAIDVTSPPLSFYVNAYNDNVWLFEHYIARSNDITDIQWTVQSTSGAFDNLTLNSSARVYVQDTQNDKKIITTWAGTGANETKLKTGVGEHIATYAFMPTTRSNTRLGCVYAIAGEDRFLDGKITTLLMFNTDIYSYYDDLKDNI